VVGDLTPEQLAALQKDADDPDHGIKAQQAKAEAGNKDGSDSAPYFTPGSFATKAEAEAYLAQARAEGKFPQVIAEDGSGDFIIEVDGRWHTAVADTDPNVPLEVHMEGQG
jgi:hypothetical protein